MRAFQTILLIFLIGTYSMIMVAARSSSTSLRIRSTPRPNYENFEKAFGFYERDAAGIECDGEEHFKSDLGILSFKLSFISSFAGLFSLLELSLPSNNITILSTFISLFFWVPSAVLTFFAWSDPLSWAAGNLVNLGSLIITLYGGLGIITGTADLAVSAFDEVLGITALIIGSLTTFPDVYDDVKEVVENWFGRQNVNDWLQNYGCNPQSKFKNVRKWIHDLKF